MTRTTPELAPPSPNFHATPTGGRLTTTSAALSIWQDNWDNGETGRSTHDIVSRVSNKPIGWNREELMLVTGHGPFPSYLHRFNLRAHDNCSCGEKRRSNALCRKMSVYPLLPFLNSNSVT
ncbi:hypothetical protein AVEN_202569-1 [Araneus ventricosus]|uniref:Uncharacterized protein n=1 Tax=Araneus ventricosus TaxID=182803 RepID=A0A4Y2K508_ARAVE|nr:hypothetical protein AVEN_202569-1 [Araneus ventricosus]